MTKTKNSKSDQAHLEQPLEAALGWPGGTLSFLRAAFTRGARRQDPWDLALLGALDAQSAALRAASVFRRGVPTLPADPALKKPVFRDLKLHVRPSVKEAVAKISAEFSASNTPVILVVDEAVAKLWPDLLDCPDLSQKLTGHKFARWIFKGGEAAKNLDSVGALLGVIRGELVRSKTSSPEAATVVAIGGGVTLDLAGFAAGLAGCRHINIPTTLLAMVDAAIGGKTGVNFEPWGKNQVGLFHFPERVILCPEFLQTLPLTEIRAGGAEALKHGLIAGDLDLVGRWADYLSAEPRPPTSMITAIAQMKADFVRTDPFETSGGTRELLNLGHTIGHALESLSWNSSRQQACSNPVGLRHGAAVAFGLLCKVHLMMAGQPESTEMGRKIISHLVKSRCLDEFRGWYSQASLAPEELWQAMVPYLMQDKKINSATIGRIRIVGLEWKATAATDRRSEAVSGRGFDVGFEELKAAMEKAIEKSIAKPLAEGAP